MSELDHPWVMILVGSFLFVSPLPTLLAVPSMYIASKTIHVSLTPKSLFLSQTFQFNFRLIEPSSY